MYVNDLEQELDDKGVNGIDIGMVKLLLLLYADDIVLFAKTAEELQKSLDILGPPGFNCSFSFAPVFQWCCSTPQGSPGVGRNTFLSSPHLCFITVFICDLFVSRDDPLMS